MGLNKGLKVILIEFIVRIDLEKMFDIPPFTNKLAYFKLLFSLDFEKELETALTEF